VPYIIRPRDVRRTVAGLASALAMIAAAPTSAAASTPCPAGATTHPFAQYGDDAAYSLVPNGDFESGSAGWSLYRAEVIGESAPTGGSHALALNPGGVAVSPPFCVSLEYPSFRFFLRQLHGGGKLYVRLRYQTSSGDVREKLVAALSGSGSWTPSPVLALAGNLPLLNAQEGLDPVQLVFSTSHPGLAWAIDDVSVDPYSR
jgi:hypothetical protein